MSRLIYIADPMCSWCYGFGSELETLLSGLPGMPLELVVGGLRPDGVDPLDDELRTQLQAHWKKVEAVSGRDFSGGILDRAGFVYNTEPACRALVAMGLLHANETLHYFNAIQHAFYAEGRDVTQTSILADIAQEVGIAQSVDIDRTHFLETWHSEEAIQGTRADFARTQAWGITGFPSLLLEYESALHLVNAGFTRTEELVNRLQAIVDGAAEEETTATTSA